MNISIASLSGMELANKWDDIDENWTQHLDLRDQTANHAPLKPVTWVDSQQVFYAASYTSDGRMTGIDKQLSDDLHANKSGIDGYYIKTTFYA